MSSKIFMSFLESFRYSLDFLLREMFSKGGKGSVEDVDFAAVSPRNFKNGYYVSLDIGSSESMRQPHNPEAPLGREETH